MLRVKTMRPRVPFPQRGSGRVARNVQVALWTTCALLLLLVLWAYPSQQQPAQETLTIKATLSKTTLGGQPAKQLIDDAAAADTLQTELSDASEADWQPARGGLGVTGAADTPGEQARAGRDRIISNGKIYAVPASNGMPIKYYYKLQNVRLTRKALYFYHDHGFQAPKDVWVDFVSGNLTQPSLPSMIVIKGDVKATLWHYLPVHYLSADASQPACTSWVDKPVYLMQARYSYNIWHTWNEGLMGMFQTLREQGYLPLVQVDAEGNMREVTEGMGPECPLVWDPDANTARPEPKCMPKTGVVAATRCDPKNQGWCREGVVSYSKQDGPIILPYSPESLVNPWAHLYSAMTEDIREWGTVDGVCFRNLIVGKTSTLNFYQPINTTNVDSHRQERVEAMSVFKRFATSAHGRWVEQQRMADVAGTPPFKGYKNKQMEALRQGVGPECITSAANIQPRELRLPLLQQEVDEMRMLLSRTGLPFPHHEMLLVSSTKGKRASRTLHARKDLLADEAVDAQGAVDGSKQIGTQAAAAGTAAGGLGAGASDRDPEQLQQQHGQVANADPLQDPTDGTPLEASTAAAAALLEQQVAPGQGAADVVEDLECSSEEAEEAEELLAEREAALERMPQLLPGRGGFHVEQPRPVVTYMSRNFFSRGVLNEQDVLEYILSRYNVTLRVTTFEEPLLEVMQLLARTDVLIGMHGAGWTNGIFIKHGATCVQLFPYGWRLPDGSTIRGHNYREIVLASETNYLEWVNPHWQHAFFRRQDFQKRWNTTYRLHPDPHGPHPKDGWPGNFWIYQNTYADMASLGPVIDEAMQRAGILPMQAPVQVQRLVQS